MEVVYPRDQGGVNLEMQTLGSSGAAVKLHFCYDVGFLLDRIPSGWIWSARREK